MTANPRDRSLIVATMLSGNSESIVADAIDSVIRWVDLLLLIDTGITDRTLDVARDFAGDKLRIERFTWCSDFAKARNFSLERATDAGAAWALTIDTDERLIVQGYESIDDLRSALEADSAVLSWMAPARDDSYAKERFVRLPTHLKWKGRTHEALTGATATQRKTLPGVRFYEQRKTPEQFQHKLRRDLVVLREETSSSPDNARWWFYLGQTLEQLEDYPEAIIAYRHCCDLRDGWAEQAAWASYCAATCFLKLDDYETALEVCAFGLSRHAATPELAWLAGYCCYQLGRYWDAASWEEMAISIGSFEGTGAASQRIGFRHLPAWYEAPYDVLRFAYRHVGEGKRATACEDKFQRAMQTRQAPTLHARAATGATSPTPLPSPRQAKLRVAVLGLYGSGSSAVAGVLHHLGVVMGRDFWGDHYEARWLSEQLRSWWREPELTTDVPTVERVRVLRQWAEDLQSVPVPAIGAKHPLLCLCGDDLRNAWGANTKFIWAYRPFEDSVASLQRRNWWPGQERRIQERLWEAASSFFASQAHLKIPFDELLRHPKHVIQRIVQDLGLQPPEDDFAGASASIRHDP